MQIDIMLKGSIPISVNKLELEMYENNCVMLKELFFI